MAGVDVPSRERTAASATTDAARIRELLLANLFAVFSERDGERRLQVIARNYTEDVIWTDPDGTTHGHEEMNEQAQKLLDRMPDVVLSAAGPVRVSRDLGLLAFNLGVPEQPPAVSGIDVALVRDGRIAVLHTLLTRAAEDRGDVS
jgi:SnoaL-like domain